MHKVWLSLVQPETDLLDFFFASSGQSRVPVLSWHGHLLSSGCRDGSIHHHDVRVARHRVGELLGHTAEVSRTFRLFWFDAFQMLIFSAFLALDQVCGLTWRSDGQALASGGNDNVVNCWE